MRTAQQVDGDYTDQLGRCEDGGELVIESELEEFDGLLLCENCRRACVGLNPITR